MDRPVETMNRKRLDFQRIFVLMTCDFGKYTDVCHIDPKNVAFHAPLKKKTCLPRTHYIIANAQSDLNYIRNLNDFLSHLLFNINILIDSAYVTGIHSF